MCKLVTFVVLALYAAVAVLFVSVVAYAATGSFAVLGLAGGSVAVVAGGGLVWLWRRTSLPCRSNAVGTLMHAIGDPGTGPFYTKSKIVCPCLAHYSAKEGVDHTKGCGSGRYCPF